jgi:hypothetical protein
MLLIGGPWSTAVAGTAGCHEHGVILMFLPVRVEFPVVRDL